jgi:hypothetical protein
MAEFRPSLGTLEFPMQRVSNSEKSKPEWYANCIDYIIAVGLSVNDKEELEKKINIMHGDIPDEFYRKTLNPYNSNKEKYQRFPATMRNFDIMNDIIRRYVSEYIKGVHDFVVGSNDPNVIINKNAKLKEQVTMLIQQAAMQEFQNRLQQELQNGTPEDQIDPQSLMPDMEQFVKDFEEKYIDDASKQGQDLLNYIQSMTNDEVMYSKAYFDFVTVGECYSYADVRGNEIFKEVVPVIEAYPIPNNQFFVEDHDMFARRQKMSYQQIIDMFDDYLTDKDRDFLETYYAKVGTSTSPTLLRYDKYLDAYPDVCCKFNDVDRNFFKSQPVNMYDCNTQLYDVWHVVWKGEVKRGILTYINSIGMVDKVIVEEGFKLDKSLGHISIEWVYDQQVYEGYRIGTRYNAVYPIKARAVLYNRNGKLPYNGIMEVLPQFGKFSIIQTIAPYQILRNIIAYHREMVIAKNKMLIMIMPQSLLGDEEEDKIYKMAADGVLYYDDSLDSNSVKAQQIRLLNANLGQYITELTNLMDSIKAESREVVDMTAQRYGEIANSAGKSVTEEAIARGSMGSVIITFIFDKFRETDYNRDLDFAKYAYVDGLNSSYFDINKEMRYISLDVNTLTNSDLSTTVRNNVKEVDKLNQLKQWAFNASQNGDLEMAVAAITGDNVSSIKKVINDYANIKRQHEEQMQQAEQMLEQQKIQNELQKIQAKGEEDRKTKELEYYYEMQAKYIDVDVALLNSAGTTEGDKNQVTRDVEASKREIEKMKVQLDRDKMNLDAYNAAADRQVKREQMKNDLAIAKENKNRYDLPKLKTKSKTKK